MRLIVQSTVALVLFCVYLGNAHPFSTFEECVTRKNVEYETYFNKGDMDSLVDKVFDDGRKEKVTISLKSNEKQRKLDREGAIQAYRDLKATGIKQVKFISNSNSFLENYEKEGLGGEAGKLVFTYEGDVNKTVQYLRSWKEADNMEWRIVSEYLIWDYKY